MFVLVWILCFPVILFLWHANVLLVNKYRTPKLVSHATELTLLFTNGWFVLKFLCSLPRLSFRVVIAQFRKYKSFRYYKRLFSTQISCVLSASYSMENWPEFKSRFIEIHKLIMTHGSRIDTEFHCVIKCWLHFCSSTMKDVTTLNKYKINQMSTNQSRDEISLLNSVFHNLLPIKMCKSWWSSSFGNLCSYHTSGHVVHTHTCKLSIHVCLPNKLNSSLSQTK